MDHALSTPSPIQRPEGGAGAIVGGLRLQRTEARPDARAADPLGGDVVHIDRDAQQRGERDQVAADVAVGDGAVVRAPVVYHLVDVGAWALAGRVRYEAGGGRGGVGTLVQAAVHGCGQVGGAV